jgi:glutamate--cysteine ligase
MGWKLRAAMGVSSIVTAMFANSPFQNGRPSGLKTFRASVWRATDPDRSGLLPFVFEGDLPTYERYARWALDVPMFFVAREGQLVRAHGRTFRDLWERGFEGLPALSSLSDARGRPLSRLTATMEDWELHLSTLFPDVRLKTYLETRTTDCVPPRYIPALPAIWKGILYDQGATEAAWDLVKRWSMDERWQHRDAVLEHALAAPVPGSRGRTVDLAKELLAIARVGLAAQAASAGHADESIYLDPIGELVERGLCPADELLAKWRPGMTSRDLIAALVEPE